MNGELRFPLSSETITCPAEIIPVSIEVVTVNSSEEYRKKPKTCMSAQRVKVTK